MIQLQHQRYHGLTLERVVGDCLTTTNFSSMLMCLSKDEGHGRVKFVQDPPPARACLISNFIAES